MRQHSSKCTNLVKLFESLCLKAVPDPKTHGEPWTIGYGHATGVRKGDMWTEAMADKVLEADLMVADAALAKLIGNAPTSQSQWDALTSLVFNVGAYKLSHTGPNGAPRLATLLQDHIAGHYPSAAARFVDWRDPGSNVEAGLLRRRKAEAALYRSLT